MLLIFHGNEGGWRLVREFRFTHKRSHNYKIIGSCPSIFFSLFGGHSVPGVSVSDIPVLVLFLHHHNNVGPGSTLQLTSHAVVVIPLQCEGEGKKC